MEASLSCGPTRKLQIPLTVPAWVRYTITLPLASCTFPSQNYQSRILLLMVTFYTEPWASKKRMYCCIQIPAQCLTHNICWMNGWMNGRMMNEWMLLSCTWQPLGEEWFYEFFKIMMYCPSFISMALIETGYFWAGCPGVEVVDIDTHMPSQGQFPHLCCGQCQALWQGIGQIPWSVSPQLS